jgi:hypothetical protein
MLSTDKMTATAVVLDAEAFPELDRPPTYVESDPRHPTIDINHAANPLVSFEDMSPLQGHTYEIHNSHQGLDVTSSGRQLYHIARYEQADSPDVVIYGGYDSLAPQLANSYFTLQEKNLRIYLGGVKHPGPNDWDSVRSASDGKLFHSLYYRFEAPIADRCLSDEQQQRRKFYWQKTHDPKIGASKLSRETSSS